MHHWRENDQSVELVDPRRPAECGVLFDPRHQIGILEESGETGGKNAGPIAFTRIPSRPHSAARLHVRATTSCLRCAVRRKGEAVERTLSARGDTMLMIEPAPASIITLPTNCVTRTPR